MHRAQEAIDGARERAALAVAAARAVEREEVAAAEAVRDAAVRRAAAEGLTVAKVSELVGLPAAEVRRILRTTDPDSAGAAGGWAIGLIWSSVRRLSLFSAGRRVVLRRRIGAVGHTGRRGARPRRWRADPAGR